jgi:hypothetical protein
MATGTIAAAVDNKEMPIFLFLLEVAAIMISRDSRYGSSRLGGSRGFATSQVWRCESIT